MKEKNISLSVPKGYSLPRSHQKGNEESGKRGLIGVRLLYHPQTSAS